MSAGASGFVADPAVGGFYFLSAGKFLFAGSPTEPVAAGDPAVRVLLPGDDERAHRRLHGHPRFTDRTADQRQHCRMQRIEKLRDRVVGAIDGQCVLDQVIGADR